MDKKTRYDLVVYGATGFTGRLIVEYIINEYGINSKDFSWAIAGRNKSSLSKIRKSYDYLDKKSKNIPIILADCEDPDSLDLMTSSCSIIVSTVGPYLKYGSYLVESCVKNKTHYCDLTGEVQFIRDSIIKNDSKAKLNKVKVVHCCGFDSLPSDLGVQMLQSSSIKKFNSPCNYVTTYASARGGLSGGTFASMINIFNHIKLNPDSKHIFKNLYCLDINANNLIPVSRKSLKSIIWSNEEKGWLCPFIMSGINSRVVYKTNSISDFQYGTDFSYSEVSFFKRGISGFLDAWKLYLSLIIVRISMSFSPLLFLLRLLYIPKPGNGPSKEIMKNGYFKMRIKGKTSKNEISQVTVYGNSDPGYSATAKMITESALALILNKDKVPESFGVLTPASAIGPTVIDRLKTKGITFTIDI